MDQPLGMRSIQSYLISSTKKQNNPAILTNKVSHHNTSSYFDLPKGFFYENNQRYQTLLTYQSVMPQYKIIGRLSVASLPVN